MIGPPNPKLLEGMQADHEGGPGTESKDTFITGNYGVSTCSAVEWAFVMEADGTPPASLGFDSWPEEAEDRLPDRSRCRKWRPLSEVEEAAKGYNERLEAEGQPALMREELIAAVLYTGPVRAPTSRRSHSHARVAELIAHTPPARSSLAWQMFVKYNGVLVLARTARLRASPARKTHAPLPRRAARAPL